MKVRKYSAPLRALVDMGPQISECINPSTLLALFLLLENVALAYFPRAHPLHTSSRYILKIWNPYYSAPENSQSPMVQMPHSFVP